MKAIAFNKSTNKLNLINISSLIIKDDEVYVKTLKTGICSTDRELLAYKQIIAPEGFDFLIIGHEAVGEVMQVGSRVSQFQIGDIVVPTVRRGCGKCAFCNSGRSDLCSTGLYKERGIFGLHGFMSEYFVEKAEHLIKVPKYLKEMAVLVEPLSVGVKAIEESYRIQKNRLYGYSNVPEKGIFKKALVVGAGSIGLLSGLVVKILGMELTCFDKDNEDGIKSNIIKKIEGQYVNLTKYIKNNLIDFNKLCNDYNIKDIDLIIDASGSSLICLQLLQFLKHNGICVLLSISYDAAEHKFNFMKTLDNLVFKNQIIVGSVNSNYGHFLKAVQNLKQAEKKFKNILDNIITHQFSFSEYSEAFNVKPKNRIKVILNWD